MTRTELVLKTVWALLNPRAFTPTDPFAAQWFSGAEPSHTGRTVTPSAAMQVSTVFACASLIAETISTLPLVLTREKRGGAGRVEANDMPLAILLRHAPNADMSGVEFWDAMVARLLLWGNAYAEIVRGFGGAIVALVPVHPDAIGGRRMPNGAVRYTVTNPDGAVRELPEENVLHLKGFSLDGLVGLSVVGQARQSLGIALAAEESAGRTFANGMRIGGYVSMPPGQTLTPEQRVGAYELLDRFKGAHNSGKIPILEGGWRFEPVTMPPAEAQLLQTREFGVEEICRWFRVPPFMVGHTTKTTSWGTGLEQQLTGFLMLTLRPHLKRIEAALERRLLTPAERGRIDIEFNVEGLLRADSAGRAAFYVAMVQNGIYSRDEVRAKENMPLRGGAADELTVQSQNVPLERTGGAPSPDPTPQTPQLEGNTAR